MAISSLQPPRTGMPQHEGNPRDALTRFAFWFFAVTLILAFAELGWRLLTL